MKLADHWLWLLLVAAPLALVADWLGLPHVLVFSLAALGVVPLAALIGRATEELAADIGPALGGLLNATFGNAAELIIAVLAIRHGLLALVKASITGSIVGNSLMVLGVAMLVGGVRHGSLRFARHEAGHHATLMALAVAGLFLPAVFARSVADQSLVGNVSLLVAGILLLTYVTYLAYSIFWDQPAVSPAAVKVAARHHSRRRRWIAVGMLAAATAATVIVSEVLVRTVEPVTRDLGWSEFFVGVIIVPLIGNAAEHFSAVTMAAKNRIDVTMGIAAGSSTQIAVFVAPLLVFISLLLGHPLDLVFHQMELLALGLTTAIFALIAMDGRSNWLEGTQLLALYLMIACAFFFLPIAQQ
ncbi:MAG TPA: calcium/proton exchanger [Chloroflexota bacterium]|nr:calcium/proton exchanger [Chloroflexota bacterium]